MGLDIHMYGMKLNRKTMQYEDFCVFDKDGHYLPFFEGRNHELGAAIDGTGELDIPTMPIGTFEDKLPKRLGEVYHACFDGDEYKGYFHPFVINLLAFEKFLIDGHEIVEMDDDEGYSTISPRQFKWIKEHFDALRCFLDDDWDDNSLDFYIVGWFDN